MAGKSLKILLVFDLSIPISAEEYPEYLKTEDWKTQKDVLNALTKLGHEVTLFGIHNSIAPLIEEVTRNRPDLVFNLSEAFDDDRKYEPNLVALFELLKLRYTGANVGALNLCKDKGLTKKILSYHRMHVPKFVVAKKSHPVRSLKRFHFPAFIKPLGLEASEGIAQLSFAENEKEAMERVKFVNERVGVDAIVEEYIEGRELYVGIIGNERLTVFPPRELFFREVPDGEPKFATFRAKWDESYRKKWGIDTGNAKALPEGLDEKISEICKKIYRVLQLSGYGRIDLRLRPNGDVVFIEANPNPSIAKEDDFAMSAAKSGLDYESLIAKMISLSGI